MKSWKRSLGLRLANEKLEEKPGFEANSIFTHTDPLEENQSASPSTFTVGCAQCSHLCIGMTRCIIYKMPFF